MAGDFDDVVDAAQDPDVAVMVALRGVAREIDAGNAAPVFALEALVVAVDGAEHRGPGLLNREVAGFSGAHRLALQDLRLWRRCRAAEELPIRAWWASRPAVEKS